MIITAIYLGMSIQLSVDDGFLVYDGVQFVEPASAKTVMLVHTTGVSVVGNTYDIQNSSPIPVGLTIYNQYVCTVTSVTPGTLVSVFQPVTSSDPTGGNCICGITCSGTEVQAVQIIVS